MVTLLCLLEEASLPWTNTAVSPVFSPKSQDFQLTSLRIPLGFPGFPRSWWPWDNGCGHVYVTLPSNDIYNKFWLVVSTHLKNISQNGNLPQIGVKIKNIWNHHLELESFLGKLHIPSEQLKIHTGNVNIQKGRNEALQVIHELSITFSLLSCTLPFLSFCWKGIYLFHSFSVHSVSYKQQHIGVSHFITTWLCWNSTNIREYWEPDSARIHQGSTGGLLCRESGEHENEKNGTCCNCNPYRILYNSIYIYIYTYNSI